MLQSKPARLIQAADYTGQISFRKKIVRNLKAISIGFLIFLSIARLSLANELPINTRLGGDFTLISSTGKPVSLSQFRGNIVLITFGFTHCEDSCPLVLTKLSQLLKKAGSNANKIQILFITVDPERDSSQKLKTYLKQFDSRILGLTGSPQQLAKVAQQFAAAFSEQKHYSGKYKVAHTDRIYLLDQIQNVRMIYPLDITVNDLWSDAKPLITE